MLCYFCLKNLIVATNFKYAEDPKIKGNFAICFVWQ
jgi:hypothetical protein